MSGGMVKRQQARSSAIGKGRVHTQGIKEPDMIDREEVTENDGGRDRKMEKGGDVESEQEERSLDLGNYIRDDILETVDECLTAWEKSKIPVAAKASDIFQRCVVCTLPHGTCKHNQQWFDNRKHHSILDPLPRDSVELTMEDISDVLTPAPGVQATIEPGNGVPSFSHLHWETLRPQPTGERLDWSVDTSTPCPRSGNTMVLLDGPGSFTEDTRLLVVYGGVSLVKSRKNLNCVKAHADGEDGLSQRTLSYNADVWVFRVSRRTWYCPNITGELPRGRYGHVSLALGSEMMWMFGGRLEGGSQGGNTYILDSRNMQWERTNVEDGTDPSPSPRVWSAAARVGGRVFLFGGADLNRGSIFDDVWTWNTETRYWEEQIVIGNPPVSRYGHALLACPDGKVLVLGGCCVSTSAEEGLPKDHDQLKLRIRVAAGRVTRAYQVEEAETAVGMLDKFVELGGSIPALDQLCGGSFPASSSRSNNCVTARERWKSLSRWHAQLAAAAAVRERETSLREEELRTVLHEEAVMTYWAKLHSRHPLKKMDTTFLDTESMIWGMTNPPPSGHGRSSPPAARMQFSAVLLHQKVVMWGGCFPTSRQVEMTDEGVHVFDLVHRRWSRIVGQGYREGMRPRVDAALGQLRRAERALFEAKQRAMSLSAPRGRTLQVIQAEAVISVNRWKVRRLEEECRQAAPSARPRAAHAGCAVGHRVMYFGGWGAGSEKGELLVLDIEEPCEKERRLEKEFHDRLEWERREREATEAGVLKRAVLQERMAKSQESARVVAETVIMAAEDARSAVPELTIAPTPRLRYANSTTIWIEWDRPTVDCLGNPPDEPIQYILYMRGGFREWELGEDVVVEYLSKAQRRAVKLSSGIATSAVDIDSLYGISSLLGREINSSAEITPVEGGRNSYGVSGGDMLGSNHGGDEGSAPKSFDTRRFFPAVITRISIGGLFDIRWANGECERGVQRHRIHRPASVVSPWAVIYSGAECRYAVEGMVPDYVIHCEGAFSYEVGADFSLQTKGVEMPREKLSRHSVVVTLQTKFLGQGPVDSKKRLADERTPGNIKARLVSAKVLDESIAASRVKCNSSLSQLHVLHGQYIGKGKGEHYL